MTLAGFPILSLSHGVLIEAGGHSGDRSASEGGVRLNGLTGKSEILCWVETLVATLAPLSRHLSFAGL